MKTEHLVRTELPARAALRLPSPQVPAAIRKIDSEREEAQKRLGELETQRAHNLEHFEEYLGWIETRKSHATRLADAEAMLPEYRRRMDANDAKFDTHWHKLGVWENESREEGQYLWIIPRLEKLAKSLRADIAALDGKIAAYRQEHDIKL